MPMSLVHLHSDPREHGRRVHLSRINGTYEKLSNLMCLARFGFYDHFEEDGLFYLNMSIQCRPHWNLATIIFKSSQLYNKT